MTARAVLRFPDPRLRAAVAPVGAVTEAVRALVADLADTMARHRGVGLAAPQLGVALAAFVVDAGDGAGVRVFLDPVLVGTDGVAVWTDEGCLSFPGRRGAVRRPPRAVVRAVGLDGAPVEVAGEGLLAQAMLHELEHLRGVLLVDNVARADRRAMERAFAR